MSNLIPFQSKPVSILWSPRKRTNPAWRVNSQSTVVDFVCDTYEEGGYVWSRKERALTDQWHALCQRFMDKYDTDWNQRNGFNPHLLTMEECEEYGLVYRAVMRARGAAV
jgi:hypothetical protein